MIDREDTAGTGNLFFFILRGKEHETWLTLRLHYSNHCPDCYLCDLDIVQGPKEPAEPLCCQDTSQDHGLP